MRWLERQIRRWWRARDGGVAVMFALGGPAVIVIGVGAIDLLAVHSAMTRLQTVADAAALAGAPALALATDGAPAKERADAFVAAEVAEWSDAPSLTSTYEITDRGGQRAIHVVLSANRPSFFANLLPPGGWNFRAEATATSVGLVPLCVLATSRSGSKVLNIKDSSRMNAPACLVHSNRDIEVEGGTLTAASAQAVTTARGYISPAASTGAAVIADPFAALDLDYSRTLTCTVADLLRPVKHQSGYHEVHPGRHCGGIEIYGTAKVKLLPGDHFFLGGHLIVKEGARAEGDDVALFFDKESKFEFKDAAMVDLKGRKSGAYAGIVMGGTRDNTQDFVISSDNVESLLGVIYVPSARLIVEGKEDVARESAWTVIVAKSVELKGSPSLFINANYNASNVPVPDGVGPRAGGARLIE